MSKSLTKKTPQIRRGKIYRREEFAAFLETIKHGQIAFWYQIAEAIGVDRDTIGYWRTLPEAQQAISEGLAYALEQMSQAGKKDWRQWHEKAKLLTGKSDTQIQVNFILQALAKYNATTGEGIDDIPNVEAITE